MKSFSGRLGLDTAGSVDDIAVRRCDFEEADFKRKANEPSRIVESLAPKERKELWRKLDIFPGGVYGGI